MAHYEVRKRWSDRFLPEIKSVLGQVIIGEPPIEEDQMRNTDLMVLKMSSVRIACRVRKYQYIARYGDEFTIRSQLASGKETELQKVLSGWGDYIFYGFADMDEVFIERWFVGSLDKFRLWFNRECCRLDSGEMPGASIWNADGSTRLTAFKVHSIPGFVTAHSGDNSIRGFGYYSRGDAVGGF